MSCPPETHYITLPYGAMDIYGRQPNELFFPLRQTYSLSSPEHRGDLEWLMVRNRINTSLINMGDGNNLLREQGIYQYGVDTIGLKVSPRKWGLQITLIGSGGDDAERRLAFGRIMVAIGDLFAADLATVLLQGNEDVLASRSDQPNPWTYSIVRGDGEIFHADFAIGYTDESDDVYSPAYNQWDTRLTFESDEPYFYGELVEKTFEVKSDGFIFNEDLFYTGTYRTPFRLEFSVTGDVSVTSSGTFAGKLAAIQMFDTSLSPAYTPMRAFQYVEYPINGNGWPNTELSSYAPFIFDTENKFLSFGFTDNLHLSADPESQNDWSVFQFAPKRRYNFKIIGTTDVLKVFGKITYRRRYSSI